MTDQNTPPSLTSGATVISDDPIYSAGDEVSPAPVVSAPVTSASVTPSPLSTGASAVATSAAATAPATSELASRLDAVEDFIASLPARIEAIEADVNKVLPEVQKFVTFGEQIAVASSGSHTTFSILTVLAKQLFGLVF